MKYKLVDEIARSCLEPAPLALEYYSELQLEQVTHALLLDQDWDTPSDDDDPECSDSSYSFW